MVKKTLLIFEYLLTALLGVAIIAIKVEDIVAGVPYGVPFVVIVLVFALLLGSIGCLRDPLHLLPYIWVWGVTITTTLVVRLLPPTPHSPFLLITMVVVALFGRRNGWLVALLFFVLNGPLQYIMTHLMQREIIDFAELNSWYFYDPMQYGYLFLAGLFPALAASMRRSQTYIPRVASLPQHSMQSLSSGKVSELPQPSNSQKTQIFSVDHISGIRQEKDEKEIADLLSSVVFFMSKNFKSFSSLGFTYDPQHQIFHLNSFQSKSMHIIRDCAIALGSGIVGKIGTEKRSFMTGDIRVYNSEILYYSTAEQVNSILAVPIISEKNELLGTLVLDSLDKQAFKDQDKETLKRFSSLAAALITTARMRTYQEQSAKTFQMFYEVSHQFTTALNPREVFNVLMGVIPTAVSCTRQIGIIFNKEDHVGKVIRIAGSGDDIVEGYDFPINSGIYSFVFQKRKQVNLGDFQQYGGKYYRFVPNEKKNSMVRSLIIFPLLDDEQRCRGLFSVESDVPNLFAGETEQILTTLMENASVAFIRALLYQRMELLATTDGLTGLNNHRNFQELLAKEIERSRRYKRPIALLLMDIDHFKKFNDTYGHPVGDLVLKEIARCIHKSIRINDIPARYGGEEFVVIVPETTEQGALVTAERIRTTIEEHVIDSLDRQLKVTVSIGISAYPEWAANQAELIDTADKALYTSKESGRNKVTLFKR